jgi:hypothetical protein
LCALFLAYLAAWTRGNAAVLFDPMVQADDARTILFPFHRYGPEGALADDPVAREMAAYTPPFVRGLYAVLVPWVGLHVAPKIVQALSLLVLFWAGWIAVRSRRVGLAGGVLLVFLFLHSGYCVRKIAGGLPRSFAFPALALWIAGALAGRERVRVAATVVAAATYPVAALLLLAAEGLYTLRSGLWPTRALRGRLLRYSLTVALAALVLAPYLVSGAAGDRVHTLAEAAAEPAFGRQGRLLVLPFADGGTELMAAMTGPFAARGSAISPAWGALYRRLAGAGPLLFLALLLLIPVARVSAPPLAAASLLLGSIAVYALAIALAFRLYSPARYTDYGGTVVVVALAVASIGHLRARWREPRRAIARNLAATAFIAFLCLLAGDGIVPRTGGALDGRRQARLYEFARGLPSSSRIAAHPLDGDDLPFWAGRSTLVGYETLQPWYVGSWGRQKELTTDLLRALYATDRQELLDFTARHAVTHLLLRPARYDGDFKRDARLFEPFGSFTDGLLEGRAMQDLVLASVPPEAVVFRDRAFLLVDVARLREAWVGGGGEPTAAGRSPTRHSRCSIDCATARLSHCT